MPRYAKRQLRLSDLIERFEGRSHTERFRNARGIIERLKAEESKLWCGDPRLFTVFQDPGDIGLPHPNPLTEVIVTHQPKDIRR